MKTKFSLLLTAISLAGYAQPKAHLQKRIPETTHYQRLKIGEKVPEDFVFEYIVNYPGNKAKMSDFKGKVLILDFWNIACSPCIAAFPKMQSLQEEFKDKVQVLLVNVINDWEQLEQSGFPDRTRSPIIPTIKLPFVVPPKHISRNEITENGLPLGHLFEHAGEPFHAWIDEKGILRSTTKPGYTVTRKSIQYFLEHKKLPSGGESGIVEDLGMRYYENASILKMKNETVENSILYSSVILKNLNVGKGLNAELTDSSTGKLIGIRSNGRGILSHYINSIILSSQPTNKREKVRTLIYENRLVLDTDDPSKYIAPKSLDDANDWSANNTYYYELKLPASQMGNSKSENRITLHKMIKSDLERFFGIYHFIEKRKIPSWILIRTSNIDKLQSKGAASNQGQNTVGFIAKKHPFSIFLDHFSVKNSLDFPLKPIINETGFESSKLIDMTIKSNLNDIPKLREELKQYDLDLVEGDREIEVIIISDRKVSLKLPQNEY